MALIWRSTCAVTLSPSEKSSNPNTTLYLTTTKTPYPFSYLGGYDNHGLRRLNDYRRPFQGWTADDCQNENEPLLIAHSIASIHYCSFTSNYEKVVCTLPWRLLSAGSLSQPWPAFPVVGQRWGIFAFELGSASQPTDEISMATTSIAELPYSWRRCLTLVRASWAHFSQQEETRQGDRRFHTSRTWELKKCFQVYNQTGVQII